VEAGRFRHYDSGGGTNWKAALTLANGFQAAMAGLKPTKTLPEVLKRDITLANGPLQENSWDCGVYLLGTSCYISLLQLLAGCTFWQIRDVRYRF
jgi:hypothetical protein